jgi:hypothetical protein
MEKVFKIKELFEYIEKKENVKIQVGEEYFPKTKIYIQNPSLEWKLVKGLIKKESVLIKINIFNKEGKDYIECADNHIILTEDGFKYAYDLLPYFDKIVNVEGENYKINNIDVLGVDVVYDLEIDDETHSYVLDNGTVHHNTILTAGIIKCANDLDMRSLTIVPSTSLLIQTKDTIESMGLPVGEYSGKRKDLEEPNIVATWQSLQNNPKLMRDFECVIWDECHNAKSYVALKLMNEAINTELRIGLTGTVPKDQLDYMNLKGSFGDVLYEVKAKDLQKRNILSSIQIYIIKMMYPKEYVNSFIDWHDEIKFLQSNEYFLNTLYDLLNELEGNTLILLKNVEPCEFIAEEFGIDFISSKFKPEKRKEYFSKFKPNGKYIAIGTYSLLSTGVDIVHINNLILGPSPGKSFTKVIQSIGRGLRRKEGEKEHVDVFDFTSNLKFDKNHISKRTKYYLEAGYPFEEIKVKLGK